MRWLVAIAMIGTPMMMAQWTRIVQDGKALVPVPEPPRTFAHFQVDPCARDDERFVRNSLGSACKGKKAKHQVQILGRTEGITVYEALYIDPPEVSPYARSIFVKAAGGRHYEIFFQLTPPWYRFVPTKLFFADGTALLHRGYFDRLFFEWTFVLTATGAWELDFSPGRAKADAVLPPGKVIFESRVDYGVMTMYFSTGARSTDVSIPSLRCDGEIAVPFRIVDGRLVPGEGQFTAKVRGVN
jgi:hypothetical protein